MQNTLTKNGVVFESCKKEKGEGQAEIALTPCPPLKAAEECERLKQLLVKQAKIDALELSFDAKPYPDRPPSALHVHISMHDRDNKPLYYKRDDEISDYLAFSIGGLLATMQEGIKIFAPGENSYQRYIYKAKDVPTTISWGANNRTTAIRLPDIGAPYRHIEHRVAGADADPVAIIAHIVRGIKRGLHEKILPPPQTYGDANSDTNLTRILL